MNFRTYKLKDIGEVITGNTPSKSNSEFYDSKDVMFIKPDDLYIDRITMLNESKEYLSNKGAEHARILPQGSVLVTCIGIIGKVGILKQEIAAFNQQINAIVPNKNIVNEKYLAYKIWDYRKKLQRIANAPVVPIINKRQFSDFQIEIPPIDYQLKVVDVLDKAQELIDKRKAQIEALDQLTQSVFLEMFGDPIKNTNQYKKEKLANLCIKITDGTHHSPPTVKEGIPYITAKHLNKGGLDFFKDPTYVSLEDHQKIYERCNPEKGDVLYIKDGATTGIAAINHYDFEFSMLSSLALIKVDFNKLNNYYLTHFLNNERVFRKITSGMNGGAIKRLTLKKINNIEVVVPPIELQNQFAEIIKKIEIQKELLQKSLEELENNFNSLMQRAFKGELFND